MLRVLDSLADYPGWHLVGVAGVVCLLASLTALNLAYRAPETGSRSRTVWLVLAASAIGGAAWVAHVIAASASAPGIPVGRDLGLTALSLAAAIAVIAPGLAFAAFQRARWAAPVGGAVVGLGIACIHAAATLGGEIPAAAERSPGLLALSLVLAALFGAAALMIAVRHKSSAGWLAAASLLMAAIVACHFLAMGAVALAPGAVPAIEGLFPSATSVAFAIAGMVLLVLAQAGAVADRRMRHQHTRLCETINTIPEGLVMFDAGERLVVCNRRYLEMYRLSPDVVHPGCTLRELVAHRANAGSLSSCDPDRYCSELRAAMAGGNIVDNVVELTDGRTIAVSSRPVSGGGWVATHEDISQRKRAEDELQRTREFLDTVIENVPAPLVVKNASDLRYVLINRAGEEFLGVSRHHMIGRTPHEIFGERDAAFIVARDHEMLRSEGPMILEDNPILTPGRGKRRANSRRLTIRDTAGQPLYLCAVLEDVTERRLAEERIAHLAHHDDLTGLPNRAGFNARLAAMIAQASSRNTSFAVLCIDLDRFKEINDVFGHATGDAFLCAWALRLREAAGGEFVARVGGDEFILIQSEGDQPSATAAVAERLLASVSHEIEVDGHRLRSALSIGIAVYPTDATDATALLANADAALYRAKAEGRGVVRFFQAEMDQQLRERRAIQQHLRGAIANRELTLHYQPRALMDGAIVSFEALLRWHHPQHGNVPPGVFIPLAEEDGLIIEIGEWVLREACREAASWPNRLGVAVNLSPIQFRHGDLPGLVHAILLDTGLSPGRLELEITEGVLISDFSRTVAILRRLKDMGVRIAMDDFGTGYSSLSYLQAFPFDAIKIDRSFIANLGRNPQSAAIIRAVIGLAQGLSVPVVAEGVESPEQVAFLKRELCDEMQGYLIGRPAAIENYVEVVGGAAQRASVG